MFEILKRLTDTMSDESQLFIKSVPCCDVRTQTLTFTTLNTNRKLFFQVINWCNFNYVHLQICVCARACVCEVIPCQGAVPVCCPAGPLEASVHQQLPRAATEHPAEEDKQIPWCMLSCLFMISERNKKTETLAVILFSLLVRCERCHSSSSVFTLECCKYLWNNI